MRTTFTRRKFLTACSLAVATSAVPKSVAWGSMRTPHPKPRAGITGANVLAKADLKDKPELVALYDSVRLIPQIMDGIRCNCGCGNPPELYSLLSCYEKSGMARECVVCQGQGKLAVRLHKEGKTLEQIRVAIDAKFG
ncbi:MAG: hypothetical protein ABJC26_06965 [Gemmatimonadaceae bacterium]